MLVLPGAGFNPRPRPLEHARHGYVALDIQVHGQDVDQQEYQGLNEDNAGLKPADEYYYNVHLRCLQAVNYLLSRPDVDPQRLVVVGGSQGGRLSIVVAGLDSRIAAAVPAIAHFSNQPYWRWLRRLNGYAAPDATCPVLFNAGLIDPVSPPYGVFAAFNRWGGKDKTMVALDGHAHDWSAEFDRLAWRWLDSVLSNNPRGH